MSRPLLSLVLCFAVGSLAAIALPKSWHPVWLLALLAALLIVFWWFNRQGRLKTSWLFVPAFLAGLSYADSYLWHQQPSLDAYVGQNLNLRGQVVNDPVSKQGSWRLQLQINAVQTGPKAGWLSADEQATVYVMVANNKMPSKQKSPKLVMNTLNNADQMVQFWRMSAEVSHNQIALNRVTTDQNKQNQKSPNPNTKAPLSLQYGDFVEVTSVPLTRPQPSRNPGGFDAASYYGWQGIHYQLSLNTSDLKVTGRDDRGLFGRLFLPIRHKLLQVIAQEFSPEQGAVLAGLVLGVTDQMDPQVMDSFRTLGVVHILAVSGANVALLVFPLLAVLKRLRLSHRKRYAVAIVVVLLFGCITQGGASVPRACMMAVLWLLGRMLARESDALTACAISAWWALLMNPLALLDLSFQLTYLLTIGLFLLPRRLHPFFRKLPAKISKELVLTFTSELISVPIVLTLNSAYTPLSFVANLYLIPVLALLVPSACITMLLGLIHPAPAFLPAKITELLLNFLIQPITYAGQAGWWLQHYQTPAVWWLWLYYGCLLLFAVNRLSDVAQIARFYNKWRPIALVLGTLLLLGTALWRSFAPQDLRVTFIDVGQGDSSLIEMPHGHVWLVDGGGIPGERPGQTDIGEKIVVPVLAARGIDVIDTVVMTHPDQDHVKGLSAVFKHFQVRQVVVSDLTDPSPFYQGLLRQIREKQIPLHMAQVGEHVTPEAGVNITFWNPPLKKYVGTRSDTNSNSVVFSLLYGQRSFLFTADYEGEVEPYLQINQHIDVLKVAHHGSGYATTMPFLQSITPTEAILSVGAHNHYGHPAPSTVKRLQQIGARIWRTDKQGAIVCRTDGQKLHFSSWLETHSGY